MDRWLRMPVTHDVYAADARTDNATGQTCERSSSTRASCARCAASDGSSAWLATTTGQETSR